MLPYPLTWSAPDDVTWSFGRFVLWEAQRRLECRERTVRLGSRSLDLLLQLLKHPGEIVAKEELLASVWSGVVVDEGSVRVQMSALRKALGVPEPKDGCREWIVTVPLRGYRFVGRVLCQPADALSVSPPVPPWAGETLLPWPDLAATKGFLPPRTRPASL